MYDLYDDPLTDKDMDALFWAALFLWAVIAIALGTVVVTLVFWVLP